MSDLTINTTLRDVNTVPSRPSRSGNEGEEKTAPEPGKVPPPSEFLSSPKGKIDSDSGMFVVQFRDKDGKVTMQYPPDKAAHEYARSSSGAPQRTDVDPTNDPSEAPESA